MKIKIFYLLTFLFFISIMSFGQQKISEEGYSKAVDLGNCRFVKFSITDEEEKNRFNESCDCDDNPTFNAIQNAIKKDYELTILFSKEYNKLKKFKIDLTQQNIAKFLTDSVFSIEYKSKFEQIYAYGERRNKKESDFDEIKRQLSDDIIRELNNYMIIEKDVENNESKGVESKPNSEVYLGKVGNSWFEGLTYQIDIFSILISVIISVLLIVLFLFKYPDPENAKKDYVKRKISELRFEQTPNNNRSEINTLKNEIFELKDQLRKLQIPKEIDPPKMERNIPAMREPEKKQDAFFYLSTPNIDGSFNESSMKYSFIPGTTIYKFKKEDNDDKAYFIIDQREDAVKLALQYPDKNIEPCCEATNVYNANATNITTDTPGMAELHNGVWKITRKAEITYGN